MKEVLLAQFSTEHETGQELARGLNGNMTRGGRWITTLPDSTREYLPAPANLVLAGALAENTRRAYRRAIEDFFCRTGLSLSEVKREDVIQYRNTLMREYSPSTVALRLSVLSQVFEEAKIRGMVEYNPLERQKRPKVSQESTTEGLTEKETAAMLGLTAWAAGQLGIGFGVANCWSAVLGALVINLVSLALTLLIRGKEREKPRRRF